MVNRTLVDRSPTIDVSVTRSSNSAVFAVRGPDVSDSQVGAKPAATASSRCGRRTATATAAGTTSPSVAMNVTTCGDTRNKPSTVLQSAEQPSPSTVLPSSHASPGSRTPSPHGAMQSAGQPSPERLLPSSQTSPRSSRPLPQVPTTQILPSGVVPWVSMHCSPGGHTPPFAQVCDASRKQPACTPSMDMASHTQATLGHAKESRRSGKSTPGRRTDRARSTSSTRIARSPRSQPRHRVTISSALCRICHPAYALFDYAPAPWPSPGVAGCDPGLDHPSPRPSWWSPRPTDRVA